MRGTLPLTIIVLYVCTSLLSRMRSVLFASVYRASSNSIQYVRIGALALLVLKLYLLADRR